jgi:hypothetical protein
MKKMTQKLMFLFLLFVFGLGYSQKVAVIGMNHLGQDGFSFVATQDLSSGEVIYFTENEYNDATNAFVDASEAVVVFTASSTILKGNVVFVNESTVTANTFSVTCTGGGSCGTAVISGAGPFALGTGGESLYAYTDSDTNPTNGITTIYSVLYTGYFEGTNTITGGDIVASQNPVFDFPTAIVIDGFPALTPDRTEFIPTVPARTDVSKVVLENPSNYLHAQTNTALSTIFFTNLNLVASNPVVSVTASPTSVNENSGTAMVYTFSLSATATSAIVVNFTVGGSATFSTDYTQSGASSFNGSAGTVTILNGSNSASITLTPVGDTSLEANETISLTLAAGSGYVAGSPGAASTTINNDDTLTITPLVAVTGVNHSTTTDGFSFVALQDIASGTVVYFTENSFVNSSLAFSGTEAVLQWTAPAGGLARGQVVVATETGANSFTVTCSSGGCGSLSVVSGTFTLATTGEEFYAYLDSDNNPTNGVTSVQAVLFTGTSSVSGGTIPSTQDPSLVYTGAVVVDGFPAIAPLRTEYNPALRGTTVDRANFQNPSNWINGGSNITLSTVPFANIIISTGVANPFASVTVSPSNVNENSGTAMVYTFALSSPATSNITINFAVTGSATFTTDYTASGASSFTSSTGSVVIPNGASSATVSLTPVGDIALEVQESVVLTIATGTGYDGGSPNAATGLINNDDTTDSDPLVALVGLSHVDPDGFSFVAAQDIPAYFTDNSFNNSTLLFGSGEAVLRWTSPGSVITKGNVVVVTESAPDTFTVTCSNGTCGSVSLLSGNLAIATTGETMYAYEDNDTNPSNGVTDIYAVLFTGTSSVSGGNLPSIEDPSNIFLKALVIDGFPTTAPGRTEYDATKRNVAVSAANFEDVSNWVHAQSPPALSTVPFANLNIVDNVPPTAVCQNISVTPSVGSGSVTIVASQIDNGSSDNAGAVSLSVNPNTFTCANVGTPVTVTLTVTDTSGNTATCTATVTVLPNVTSTFAQIDPICSGDTITLPTTSNNGFTGTWSPAINNTATTTYTFTPNNGQCGGATTMTVVVNSSTTPTFNSVAPICSGDTLSALPTTSLNGITGIWSPALNNTATTTYTFTPDAGQCASTATLTITVNSTPSPVSADINVAFTGQCGFLSGTYTYEGLLNGKASFVATPSPNVKISYDGVKWVLWDSNVNITNTGFQNTTVPAGLYPPLTGWTPTQCSTGTMTITSNSNFTVCTGSTLTDIAITGTNLQWYDAATNGNLLPSSTIVTTGTYYVTQTISGCESAREAVNITVNPLTTPTFDPISPICSGDALSALSTTSLNGITGTWSPAIDNTATTTYTFTPNAGQCASTASLTITVNPLVTPTFNSVVPICSGDTLSALPTTSNNGVTGTWSPALDNTATTTYTFTPDAGQCASTVTLTITVNPLTTNTTTITAPNSYTWSVNGVTYTTSGTYNFVNGCVTEILNLTIIPGTSGPSIIPSQCGVTLDIYHRIVYANAVSGAQRYRFRVTNFGTNQVVVVENPLRHLFLRNLPIYEYDQAFGVEVAVRVNGVWSNFGSSCTITTPVVTTQVRASQCGATLATKIDIVYADNVSGVIGYRFRVTNLTSNSVQIIDRATRAFQFNAVTDYADATNYSIEVALLNADNTYLPYGSSCVVTTPTSTGRLATVSFDAVGYPNPFNESFKLDVTSSSTNTIIVRVYDMIGKLIEERNINANEIDLFELGSNYSQGVYNVIVSQDNDNHSIRMIKR